ncbi:hypothetical protein BGZ94_006807, partial [Podila epigama]
MSIYSTVPGSNNLMSKELNAALTYLSEHASMTLFSLKNVNTSSSRTVFNPDGYPVADVVTLTLRSSSIGGQNVQLQFFYNPYDWTFPPDLIIQGSNITPSLTDLGLDNTWNSQDPSGLSKVLGRISRILQHGERQRVASFENERIQVEYSCLHENEVLFAVPFYIKYHENGASHSIKACAKIQFLVSSLVDDVMEALSTIEVLSSFDHPNMIKSIPGIELRESITDYLDRVKRSVSEHFDKLARTRYIKRDFMDAFCTTFRRNLLECDRVNFSYAAVMLRVPNENLKADAHPTAIVTVYISDTFPEQYPKMTLSFPILPSNDNAPVPTPQ